MKCSLHCKKDILLTASGQYVSVLASCSHLSVCLQLDHLLCQDMVGRSDWKKKKKKLKKNHKKSRNNWPWYPRTTLKVNIPIFELTKCTIYCEKCSSFCSCFSLCCYYIPCSFFRLKESFQVKNGVTTSFLFLWKMPKIWVGWMTVNGEKKEDGLCR